MIDKINNNQSPDILNEMAGRRLNSLRSNGDNDADASLQVSYKSLIEQTSEQASTDDAKIVERARQMLLSGELDRPDNLQKAAENILKFGV